MMITIAVFSFFQRFEYAVPSVMGTRLLLNMFKQDSRRHITTGTQSHQNFMLSDIRPQQVILCEVQTTSDLR